MARGPCWHWRAWARWNGGCHRPSPVWECDDALLPCERAPDAAQLANSVTCRDMLLLLRYISWRSSRHPSTIRRVRAAQSNRSWHAGPVTSNTQRENHRCSARPGRRRGSEAPCSYPAAAPRPCRPPGPARRPSSGPLAPLGTPAGTLLAAPAHPCGCACVWGCGPLPQDWQLHRRRMHPGTKTRKGPVANNRKRNTQVAKRGSRGCHRVKAAHAASGESGTACLRTTSRRAMPTGSHASSTAAAP